MSNGNWKIVVAVVICLACGILSSIATAGAVNDWYTTIEKPAFNPPNWVFGPVWTTLYIMMGVALGLVWKKGIKHAGVIKAIWIFMMQLVANGFWSLLFFKLQSPFAALVDILLLLNLIGYTIYLFWPIDKRAAFLMIPYFLWVAFATILNASIWWLN